jgi:ribonuclease HI
MVDEQARQRNLIWTDSLRSLLAMNITNLKNPLLTITLNLALNTLNKAKMKQHIEFLWVPGHMGLEENEKDGLAAKDSLNQSIIKQILSTDIKATLHEKLRIEWQDNWIVTPSAICGTSRLQQNVSPQN